MNFIICLLLLALPQQKTVLICKSSGAYAYHDHICRGLKECTHAIERLSIDEAVKKGRKPCGYCYANSVSPQPAASDDQCKAITKKGTRCSRKAGANGYCWQHS